MTKTIRELADELGVSKSGIRKHMNVSFRNKYTFKNANRILIKDDGVKALKTVMGNYDARSEHTKNVLDIAHNGVRYEDAMMDQLKQKDKQIEHLQKLLDQSQQLQLMAENKIKQLEDQSSNDEDTEESKEPQQKNFWAKLFT